VSAPAGEAAPTSPRSDTDIHVQGRNTPLYSTALNLMSGRVSNIWCRIPFDRSELSISKMPPPDWPTVRPGRDP